MGGPQTTAVAPAPMIVRATPVIFVLIGTFWISAGLLAAFLVPAGGGGGVVWVAWGAAHLLAARGIRSGLWWAFALGGILGIVGLLAASFIILFIVSLSLSVSGGIDLGALWFAPLNGWATLLLYGLLVGENVAMLITAAWALRRRLRRT